MKVLHISTTDIEGGAAKAAYRLHQCLLSIGIESRMLVQIKKSDNYTIIPVYDSKFEKFLSLIRPVLDQIPVKFYKNRIDSLFSPGWLPFSKVIKKVNEINPDIVHLHWICGGMLRIEDLLKIKKPIVWSLHDNWAFTGGCHIMWKCKRYKYKCGKCYVLNSNKDLDLSRWVWKRKYKVFRQMNNIVIIGLSKWIAEKVTESALLKGKTVICLPNLINTDIFKPIKKSVARNILNLPLSEKLIGFGVLYNDLNKGFSFVCEALKLIKKQTNLRLIIFGSKPQTSFKFLMDKIYYIGKLNDDVSLSILYNSLDVVIVPSLQENLSNTIMESLSCGTPVVAFDVGGNSDMIDHKVNGYLAKPFDTNDLANGIEWVLNHPNYDSLRQNAREKIVKNFDSKIVVQRYVKLYREILGNKNNIM